MPDSASEIILYRTEDGRNRISVRLEEGTVWLTQSQMMELFQVSKPNISMHIRNIFREGELQKSSVVKEYLTTAADGKKYRTRHYNLDVIIAVGYRVRLQRGRSGLTFSAKAAIKTSASPPSLCLACLIPVGLSFSERRGDATHIFPEKRDKPTTGLPARRPVNCPDFRGKNMGSVPNDTYLNAGWTVSRSFPRRGKTPVAPYLNAGWTVSRSFPRRGKTPVAPYLNAGWTVSRSFPRRGKTPVAPGGAQRNPGLPGFYKPVPEGGEHKRSRRKNWFAPSGDGLVIAAYPRFRCAPPGATHVRPLRGRLPLKPMPFGSVPTLSGRGGTQPRHIANIFKEGEPVRAAVRANVATTPAAGTACQAAHFNPGVTISAGYRARRGLQRGLAKYHGLGYSISSTLAEPLPGMLNSGGPFLFWGLTMKYSKPALTFEEQSAMSNKRTPSKATQANAPKT